MRVVAWRSVHLPVNVAQPDLAAWQQHLIEIKLRTVLAGRRVGERMRIPGAHVFGQTWWNQRLQIRVMPLQRGIAAAVVAVQMGVHEHIERSTIQSRFDQGQGLRRVRNVAAVDQRRAVFADDQDVVGGEPATLEDRDAFREHGVQRGDLVAQYW